MTTVYFGQNSQLWTICIALVMTSLSLGHYAQHRMKGRDNWSMVYQGLATALLIASMLAHSLLFYISQSQLSYWVALTMGYLIFACPAFFLMAMLSSYSMTELIKKGYSVATMNMVSCVTSLMGLLLVQINFSIPWTLNLEQSLRLFALLAILAGLFLIRKKWFLLALFVVTIAGTLFFKFDVRFGKEQVLVSAYGADFEYSVLEHKVKNGGTVRNLSFGNPSFSQGATLLGKDGQYYYVPFYKELATLVEKKAAPRVLVVGFGIGNVPQLIYKKNSSAQFTFVDLEPKLLDTARQFFGFTVPEPFEFYAQDFTFFFFNTFMNQPEEKNYDFIFIDMGDSTGVVESMWNPFFYETMKKHLRPDGYLAVNFISKTFYNDDLAEDLLVKKATLGYFCQPGQKLFYFYEGPRDQIGGYLYLYQNTNELTGLGMKPVGDGMSPEQNERFCRASVANEPTNNLIMKTFVGNDLARNVMDAARQYSGRK